ncbi:MAG: pilin [Patescibacteria group bacterium]
MLTASFASAEEIPNPLGVASFAELVKNLADAVTKIAIPFVVVFLIYAGFLFVSARGNEKQLTNAKEIFKWTIIGAAVIVGADALANAAVSLVQSLGT